MIYMRNITITTAKSATYLENVGSHIDVIPDIHADLDRLTKTLTYLGYRESASCWAHPEGRIVAFLGDFIDGGDQNSVVISLVRAMQRHGHAIAIMGNHELNALLYHEHGENSERTSDGFMRAHTLKNTAQHETFLKEFPIGAPQTQEVLDWFMTLPLFIDLPGIRLVHAYWDDRHIDTIRRRTGDARLKRDDLQELAFETDASPFADAVLSSLKGPEAELPHGHSFTDIKGHTRTAVRLKWWQAGDRTWRSSALSVPRSDDLPDTPVIESGGINFYGAQEKPVFFGHYKMLSQPELAAHNALCLDYIERPCAYRWNGEQLLSTDNLILVPK